jgi:serine phosphatase RsbU (regulator of sigma subunit)/GAF domain-containing protein/anti-sigma regulatory factor (Ser/Thr protein kinase)
VPAELSGRLRRPLPREPLGTLALVRGARRFDELVLLPVPASVGQARRAARAALRAWGTPEDLEGDALVVVSELVTNAVLHARSDITLRLSLRGSHLRVEVGDADPSLPELRPYGPEAGTGRGLALVAAATDRWGAEPAAEGKVVWAELLVVGEQAATAVAPAVRVTLAAVPVTPARELQEHHDAIVREVHLVELQAGGTTSDQAAAVQRVTGPEPPSGVGTRLRHAVESAHLRGLASTDVVVDVSPAEADEYLTELHDLEEVEELASAGALLVTPPAPDLVRLRRWMCSEVRGQVTRGAAPVPFPAGDEAPGAPARGVEHRSEDRLQYLVEASERLIASLELPEVLETISAMVAPRLADACVIHLLDRDGTIRPAITHHADPERRAVLAAAASAHPIDADDVGIIARVVATRSTVHVPDASALAAMPGVVRERAEALRAFGTRSAVFVPLRSPERCIGVLSAFTAGDRTIGRGQVELVEDLSRLAATAIDHARLFREARATEAELRFQTALQEAQADAGIDGLLVVAPTGQVISYNRRFAEMWGIPPQVLVGASDAGLLEAASRLVADPATFLARIQACYDDPSGPVREELVLLDGRVIDRYGAPLRHEDGTYRGWAWYFRDVTEQRAATTAVSAAGLRFATLARTLQQSLLPPALPSIPGLDVAARYHPAGEGAEVGGDFYDVFQTGRQTWALVMGDVCGKGAEAARLTALTRYTVRTAAMEHRSPARILHTLNTAMRRATPFDDDRDRFASVAMCILRRREGRVRMTLASGGHPPPLLVRADGALERLGAEGVLLGLFDDVRLRDRNVDLRRGDSLLLYTDGVTEARDEDGRMLDDDGGLDEVVRSLWRDGPVDELCGAVESAVLTWQGGSTKDDLAILGVRVL